MANNYLEFSALFECPSPAYREAIIRKLDELSEARLDDEPWCFNYETYQDDRSIWVHSDESGTPEDVVEAFQQVMNELDFDVTTGFEWAVTCSKPRIGEFGGGCVVFSRYTADWWDSRTQLHNRLQQGGTPCPSP